MKLVVASEKHMTQHRQKTILTNLAKSLFSSNSYELSRILLHHLSLCYLSPSYHISTVTSSVYMWPYKSYALHAPLKTRICHLLAT